MVEKSPAPCCAGRGKRGNGVMRKQVRIKFTNGLSFESGVREILNVVLSEYEFIESERPDFVIFGPYGSDIPKGAFTRIGYFCENMKPDLSSGFLTKMKLETIATEEFSGMDLSRARWSNKTPTPRRLSRVRRGSVTFSTAIQCRIGKHSSASYRNTSRWTRPGDR